MRLFRLVMMVLMMGVSDPPLPNAVQQVSSQPSPDTSSKRTPRKRHKSEGLRLRLSDIQKAKAVEHFLTIPGMKQAELILWCVKEFKLEKNPSTTAVSDWLQPDQSFYVAGEITSCLSLS
jgi:hypothetical protein